MTEQEEIRLKELKSYQILDTPREVELDELAQIAALIFEAPIALITFIDETRVWLKAVVGLNISETARDGSFCRHTLYKPHDILVVNDAHLDERFKDSPLVTDAPKIRFYAGMPLESPNGNVLGTICVLDTKPNKASRSQEKALRILAKKAMDHINTRKLLHTQKDKIENSAARLKKLTDNVPGAIFQLKRSAEGDMSFEFLSSGMERLNPSHKLENWQDRAEIGYDLVHPEDLGMFKETLFSSFDNVSPWYLEYRVKYENGYKWHSANAKPEKLTDGSVVLFGVFQDITPRVEYELAMEQISFDISHVLRRPVTSLLGLTQMLDSEKAIKKSEMLTYIDHIKAVSIELDEFTRELNSVYKMKQDKVTGRKK